MIKENVSVHFAKLYPLCIIDYHMESSHRRYASDKIV